mmetsp:Transcript_28148/g.39739  ORF Transcript_28148/g.39739 Transcript_28148/m.39739 type:complete len:110 (-) Transcript_28148:24-353(-)
MNYLRFYALISFLLSHIASACVNHVTPLPTVINSNSTHNVTDSSEPCIKDKTVWIILFTLGCIALFIPFFTLSIKYYLVDKYGLFGWFKKQRIWKTFSMTPQKDWTLLE